MHLHDVGANGDGAELANLRDLGGLQVAGGGRTRHGVLYRSDAPYRVDRTPVTMPLWPPSLVIDLRSDDETPEPHPWQEASEILRLPLLRSAAVVTEAAVSNVVRDDYLEGVYRDVLDSGAEALASVISHAATADGPVLIHCAAGKDRTGLAAAVLLLAAGVSADQVVADYVATGANMGRLLNRLRRLGILLPEAPPPPAAALAAPEHLIAMVIEKLTGQPDGIVGWARRHGVGTDAVERWRSKFIVPVAADPQ
ncbi:tyrosine-protein phosphatase [Mycolicibacter algericus]|jgi:hypothetical protein|uniref:Tyrosine specific protein phosphatases domain-containing protein n=2 Tax=Mycolicibacter algericus TaxID=1288388 RepID=A0A7I9Y5W0_MYCAL|nr:tyrosine-protein phosphatase [Mycolicibacter algericus]OQZ92816.1 hypothetical protein BST10_20775 [Mycolicibacter algericus DSM 45454]GFG84066.1 hypothetical protein MALGJ_07420 [Mycolicibacter algericus]